MLTMASILCTASHLSQNLQYSGAFKYSLLLFLHTAVDPSPCNRPPTNAMARPAVDPSYIARPRPRPPSFDVFASPCCFRFSYLILYLSFSFSLLSYCQLRVGVAR